MNESSPDPDIRVLIVEDDIYARDLMAFLLTRDWRTRVVNDVDSQTNLRQVLRDPNDRVDLLLVDTEVPGQPERPFELAAEAQIMSGTPQILCTATRPAPDILSRIIDEGYAGYVIKGEIRYALAAAVKWAVEGSWVTTPSVRQLARDERILLPRPLAVMDGTRPIARFTQREQEVARLGILFSMNRTDVADELQLRQQDVNNYVSRAYKKLGLHEILEGHVDPGAYLLSQSIIERFHVAQEEESQPEKGAREKSTLAFHLMTVPDIEEISD